jgi:hypothetical protein
MPWCLLKHKMNTLQNSLPDKTRDRDNLLYYTFNPSVPSLKISDKIIISHILLMYSCFVTETCTCAAKHSVLPIWEDATQCNKLSPKDFCLKDLCVCLGSWDL